MRQFETFMQNLMQGLTHQQGQMGNNMAQLGSALQELARGTESNAVSFATDSSDISRGCQHDLRRGAAADLKD